MLAALRRVIENDASVRRGDWQRAGASTPWGLHGRCVGIVGLGRIGSAVARRLHGFECDVIAFDPYVEERPGVSLVSLDQLFERADLVTLHAPSTPETRGLVDARRLRSMRPGAILVNTSRGELVDEGALVAALTSGGLAAAALDVFVAEPPTTARLLELPIVPMAVAIGAQAFVVTHIGVRVGAKVGERAHEAAERLAGGALVALGIGLAVTHMTS